jgi:16S rRNA (adenine1518-N6/adenine1519-N6)-dimethyltransferase
VNVTPKKELGQHFLADENILGVVGRLAELSPDDVVLEIGPGLGILTAYLADRVARVHAIELDRSLEPELRRRLGNGENVELHFADALGFDYLALDPKPSKLVANLPYNVATPLVAESLDGLPALRLWTVMVQREVADRFFAAPSTKAYGAVSVLVQLAAERTGFHPVARTVFRPPPNVDSALVAFRRTQLPGDFAQIKKVVEGSFAHRRKTLPNSLRRAPRRWSRASSSTSRPRFESLRAGQDQPRAGRRPVPGGRQARGRHRPATGRLGRPGRGRARLLAHSVRLRRRHARP